MIRTGKYFNYDKNYKYILSNIEEMIEDLNNEIIEMKKYNSPIKVFKDEFNLNRLYFELIVDKGECFNIKIKLLDDNEEYFYNRVVFIEEGDRVEYFSRIEVEDNKLFYTIKIIILEPTNKRTDKGEIIFNLSHGIVIKTEIKEYKDYLESETWNKTRKEKLKEAEYKCQLCSKKDIELHVHHNTYENIGNEEMNDLIVLCKDCHSKFHDKI